MACIDCGQQFRLVKKTYKYLKLPFKRTICVSVYMCPNHHVYTPIAVWEPYYDKKTKSTMIRPVKKEEELTEEEIKIRQKQEPAIMQVKEGGCATCGDTKKDHAMGRLYCNQGGCKCQKFVTKKAKEITV